MSASPFVHHLVTRGTEIDHTATVSPFSALRYFEHLRWLMMRDPRLGLQAGLEASHFFVVRSQVLELRRRVGMGVPLTMRTAFEHCGRSTARVLHVATRDSDGAIVARARVTGVWLGSDRRLARLPDAFRAFANAQAAAATPDDDDPDRAGDPLPDPHVQGYPGSFVAPPGVVLPPMTVRTEPPRELPEAILYSHLLTVEPRDLDVFGHVNAATWMSMAHDARHYADRAGRLPPDTTGSRWTARFGLFYGREAVAGARLRVSVWQPGPRSLAYAFEDADDHGAPPLCTAQGDYSPGGRAVSAPLCDGPGTR